MDARMRVREIEGINFPINIGALAAGASEIIDLEAYDSETMARYLPFDYVSVINDSDDNVTLKPSYLKEGLLVMNNSSRTIRRSGAIRYMVVKNVSANAIDADAVQLNVGIDGMGADKEARIKATQSPLAGLINKFLGVGI